ncbi:hypothetical protein TW95_gp1526 [Pandoravirus inopinatum]|uniref:Uncharacterized protein n=1 Tax=Pandoravirus inopinatum TaxID=1605721 RepID=A0A0B5J8L0_9VIRU|nr:hypothetical protein TW95_gp1526 [Pandoravirus inopinatum]AJF98260.1 hypothetical protein [Pandoravirus inopinatum]
MYLFFYFFGNKKISFWGFIFLNGLGMRRPLTGQSWSAHKTCRRALDRLSWSHFSFVQVSFCFYPSFLSVAKRQEKCAQSQNLFFSIPSGVRLFWWDFGQAAPGRRHKEKEAPRRASAAMRSRKKILKKKGNAPEKF